MKQDSVNISQWLNTFPERSIRRLRHINNAANSANHVVLALGYGIGDSSIRSINRLIIGLMLSRMKAERSGDEQKVVRINDFLESLHECINSITGIAQPKHESVPCRAVVGRARLS
jgi:hypothetical protein